jgi:hypothetical protein
MVGFNARPGLMMELAVMMFQFAGVAALCLCRLSPRSRWCGRGRVAFIVAMFGLGVAGALCGRQDSEFALFAGLTMTVLLIGMTSGSSPAEPAAANLRLPTPETGIAV